MILSKIPNEKFVMKTLLRPKMPSEKNPFLYNIEIIPLEILTEILEHLDWQDVLRVRLVSRPFNVTT